VTIATQGRIRTLLSSHHMPKTLELDDCQITLDSVLDPPASLPTSFDSTTSSGGQGPPLQCIVFSTSTTEFVKRKQSNLFVFRVPHRPKYPSAATKTVASNILALDSA
ncbi:hypothetical protein Ancab_004325, partial [Ancistrocladus abbreviatus]